MGEPSERRRATQRDAFFAALRHGPVLMGILNVTPDSFSDGGRHFDPSAAIARARTMAAEGAAIIDVGGESTRPGHRPVAADEELDRIAPVLRGLADLLDAPLSVDTGKASVARRAARLGACAINDVWGLQRDPEMAEVVAETHSAVVVMHNRDAIDPSIDIVDDVLRFFDRSLVIAARAGVPFSRILIDPGIGFGKTPGQNHACIWNLERFRIFGAPILVGLSRKSFIGKILGPDRDDRLTGSVAADTIALLKGAAVLRVHDVKENRVALEIIKALRGAAADEPTPAREGGRTCVALSLGGNVGDAAATLRGAFRALADEPGFELNAVSRLYRTAPWGKTDQPSFINAAVIGRTTLPPEALLTRLKALEIRLGRVKTERWGPRVIDIDILAYGDRALTSESLTLPHPQLFNRAFVLVPLAEIAGDLVISGRKVADAAKAFVDDEAAASPLD